MRIGEIHTKSWSFRYSIALGLAMLAIILRYALVPLIGVGYPYRTLYPVILIAAILLGRYPAIVTAVVGALILLYLYEPLRLFPAISGLIMVILTTALAGYLTQRLHDAFAMSKQRELQSRELAEKLQDRNEEIQSLARIIRHDFGNIILNINGFSAMVEKTSDKMVKKIDKIEHPEIKELLPFHHEIKNDMDHINLAAANMKDMLAALKKISDIEKPALELQLLDMNKLLEDVLAIMKPQIDSRNVTIVRSPLPPCIADKGLINHVLLNLLSNAVKYLDPDRPGVIKIAGKTEANENIYSVSDNGIGIEPENIPKVFRMFERFVPDEFAPGDGIGLAVVKRIIEKHNGRIWAESQPGKGTTFFFSIPEQNI